MAPQAYLDHAATTPMRDEAVEAMLPYLREEFGNPSGTHAPARRARRAVDEARDQLAEVLGCEPGEIVFTGGGTESDNAAVFGVIRRHGGVALCSAIEHHAVLEPVLAVGGRTVGVDGRGVLDVDALAAALSPDVRLVSVMLANNEVGSIQPLAEVAELVRHHAPDAVIHTDAVQALCWLDVARMTAAADLVSVSAHKFGGPKGVGALVVRQGVELEPLLLGGGQERERRSGTHNVAGIVGLAVAAASAGAERKLVVDRVAELRDRLADGIVQSVPGAVETGVPVAAGGAVRAHKVVSNCHLCFEGIESESLLFLLDRAGVSASAASSCASGAMATSHVLEAMGVAPPLANGSLRLTLGPTSTAAEVDHAIDVVRASVERLRRFA
jgi:cysteine desulfurase